MSTGTFDVERQLFQKMNVSTVTEVATSGVYNTEIPRGIDPPLVVFSRYVPGKVEYAFGLVNQLEDDLYLIKAVTDKDSNVSYSPQELADLILNRCEAAIGHELTLTDATTSFVARVQDIGSYVEPLDDRNRHYRGFLLRVARG